MKHKVPVIGLFLIFLVVALPICFAIETQPPQITPAELDSECCFESGKGKCDDSFWHCSGSKGNARCDDGCCPPDTEWDFYEEVCTPACIDEDGDGFGQFQSTFCEGWFQDCNDNDAEINPGADEICDDGVDNNCDGFQNDGCPTGLLEEEEEEPDPEEYSEEVCAPGKCVNGDADCDGKPDLGCKTKSCEAIEEICNNIDDDCDGVPDDACRSFCDKCGDEAWYTIGLANPCDEEECKSLGPGCVFEPNWFSGSCTETIIPGEKVKITEVCNDIDDDGDGAVDEGLYCKEKETFVEQIENALGYFELIEKWNEPCQGIEDCGGLDCKFESSFFFWGQDTFALDLFGSKKMSNEFWGREGLCCHDYEEKRGDECYDPRPKEGGPCREDTDCYTEYCSRPVQGFWRQIGNAIVHWDDGICCELGTEYNGSSGKCVEGGIFSSPGDSQYCREKKEKGHGCSEKEGNCGDDTECLAGLYCVKKGVRPNVCCPLGTTFNGEECVESKNKDCSLCSKNGKCTLEKCNSISTECSFDVMSRTCSQKTHFLHDEGNCKDSNLKCGDSKEILECADYGDYGACCYPWEELNPGSQRCRTVCQDDFCDLDADKYNSDIELRYGANPTVQDDTPFVRMARDACYGPFDHKFFTEMKFGWISSLYNSFLSMGVGQIIEVIADAYYALTGEKDKRDIAIKYVAQGLGLVVGILYGAADDLGFALDIAKYLSPIGPILIIKGIVDFNKKWNQAQERNKLLDQTLIEKYSNEQIDSSMRNDLYTCMSDKAYEVDYLSQDSCGKQIHTKAFSSTFILGYIVQQIILIAAGGAGLVKLAGKVTNTGLKLTLKIAGKTLQFIDNPIGYAVITPIAKLLKNPIKSVWKVFGKNFLKGMSQKQILNIAEIVDILPKKAWKNLGEKGFKKLAKNFATFKNAVIKAFGKDREKEAIKFANEFVKTAVGRKILLEAWGKGGWNAVTTQRLVEAILKHGSKNIELAFKNIGSEVIKKFGKELTQQMTSRAPRVIELLFWPAILQRALKYMGDGGSLAKFLDVLQYGTKWEKLPDYARPIIEKNFQKLDYDLLKAGHDMGLAKSFLDTHIGAKILLNGMDEAEGWTSKGVGALAEEIEAQGIKNFHDALNGLTESQLRKVGKYISQIADSKKGMEGVNLARKALKSANFEKTVREALQAGEKIVKKAEEQATKKAYRYANALSDKEMASEIKKLRTGFKKHALTFSGPEEKQIIEILLKFDKSMSKEIISNINKLPRGGFLEVKRILEMFRYSELNLPEYFFLEVLTNKNLGEVANLKKMGPGNIGQNGIHWNLLDPKIAFKGIGLDKSELAEVIRNGLKGKGNEDDFFRAALTTDNSRYIHTAKTPIVSEGFGDYIFVIFSKRGIDFNKEWELGKIGLSRFGKTAGWNDVPHESIVAFTDHVSTGDMVGYFTQKGGGFAGFTVTNKDALDRLNKYIQRLLDGANLRKASEKALKDNNFVADYLLGKEAQEQLDKILSKLSPKEAEKLTKEVDGVYDDFGQKMTDDFVEAVEKQGADYADEMQEGIKIFESSIYLKAIGFSLAEKAKVWKALGEANRIAKETGIFKSAEFLDAKDIYDGISKAEILERINHFNRVKFHLQNVLKEAKQGLKVPEEGIDALVLTKRGSSYIPKMPVTGQNVLRINIKAFSGYTSSEKIFVVIHELQHFMLRGRSVDFYSKHITYDIGEWTHLADNVPEQIAEKISLKNAHVIPFTEAQTNHLALKALQNNLGADHTITKAFAEGRKALFEKRTMPLISRYARDNNWKELFGAALDARTFKGLEGEEAKILERIPPPNTHMRTKIKELVDVYTKKITDLDYDTYFNTLAEKLDKLGN